MLITIRAISVRDGDFSARIKRGLAWGGNSVPGWRPVLATLQAMWPGALQTRIPPMFPKGIRPDQKRLENDRWNV
jgi:hypothetical protein